MDTTNQQELIISLVQTTKTTIDETIDEILDATYNNRKTDELPALLEILSTNITNLKNYSWYTNILESLKNA